MAGQLAGPVGGGLDLSSYDLSQVEDMNFDLIPVGTDVELLIVKADDKKKTGAGDHMIALELKVTWPAQYVGVKIWDNIILSESAVWKLKTLLKATELADPSGHRALPGTTAASFISNVVRAQVTQEEYNSVMRNKIRGAYSIARDTPGLQ